MEENEMLELTNETENTETQTVEENVEGIEITDTAEVNEEVENAESRTEETKEVKTLKQLLKENPNYQEEFDGIVESRLRRKDRDHEREMSKYKDIENVLRVTIGGDNIEDISKNLRSAYANDDVELPEVYTPGLTEHQIEVLARDEANSIIADGYDAMVEEANRLAKKKYQNLNPQEKIVFTTLAEKLTEEKNRKELLSLGAKEELLKDEEFKKFKSQFNSNVPIKDIYGLYKGNQPKPKVDNPGSMRNSLASNEIKDFYTPEEASKFTRADYDKNPKLLEAVEYSMTRWKK